MKNIFLGLIVTLLMTACASSSSNKPLYYWDSAYDKSVYNRLNKDGDVDKEIQNMEKMAQKAYEKQQKVPPGFHAHLGAGAVTSNLKLDKSIVYICGNEKINTKDCK